jgi:phenylalanine ammonia-lyase
MAATYVFVLCQALDLRCLRLEFGGVRMEAVVRRVVRACLLGDQGVSGEREEVLVAKVKEAVLGRWDQLSHLDLSDRCRTAVNESLGTVLDCLGDCGVALEGVREYQSQMPVALERCYADLRAEFLCHQTTTEYISPASRVVYDFVRKELNIPLNRGVEDHPPLLLRKADGINGGTVAGSNGGTANGNGVGGKGVHGMDENIAARSRTLGTMAGEIYEGLRRGELHDKIMRFGEESGLWES